VCTGVKHSSEEARRSRHVVDLVGVIRSTGSDQRGVRACGDGVDLRVGVGQREDDGVGSHYCDVLAGEEARGGHANEYVRSDEDLGERALATARVGVLGDPAAVGVDRVLSRAERTVPVARDDVADTLGKEQLDDRVPGRADSTYHHPDVAELLAHNSQSVCQRGQHNDRSAVLVVVVHRDIELLTQASLNFEAPRAAMSSRLIPPYDGAIAVTMRTISSVS